MTTPKEILHKSGPLDDDEWETMRRHTIDGQRILDEVGGTLHDVGEVVRSSREHYDGGGYPHALAADAIPLPARVVAVADACGAMTTRRSYREPMTPGIAMRELRVHAGNQFDPVVVEAALVCAGAGRTYRNSDDKRCGSCVRWCCRPGPSHRPRVTR